MNKIYGLLITERDFFVFLTTWPNKTLFKTQDYFVVSHSQLALFQVSFVGKVREVFPLFSNTIFLLTLQNNRPIRLGIIITNQWTIELV